MTGFRCFAGIKTTADTQNFYTVKNTMDSMTVRKGNSFGKNK